MKNYLLLPSGYDPELSRKVNNGCGPAGWKGKLVPDTIYGINISDACKIHDFEYHVGLTLEDKQAADSRFYGNILRIINSEARWSRFLNPLRRKRAFIYFLAVSKGGDEYFLEGKEGLK